MANLKSQMNELAVKAKEQLLQQLQYEQEKLRKEAEACIPIVIESLKQEIKSRAGVGFFELRYQDHRLATDFVLRDVVVWARSEGFTIHSSARDIGFGYIELSW